MVQTVNMGASYREEIGDHWKLYTTGAREQARTSEFEILVFLTQRSQYVEFCQHKGHG